MENDLLANYAVPRLFALPVTPFVKGPFETQANSLHRLAFDGAGQVGVLPAVSCQLHVAFRVQVEAHG